MPKKYVEIAGALYQFTGFRVGLDGQASGGVGHRDPDIGLYGVTLDPEATYTRIKPLRRSVMIRLACAIKHALFEPRPRDLKNSDVISSFASDAGLKIFTVPGQGRDLYRTTGTTIGVSPFNDLVRISSDPLPPVVPEWKPQVDFVPHKRQATKQAQAALVKFIDNIVGEETEPNERHRRREEIGRRKHLKKLRLYFKRFPDCADPRLRKALEEEERWLSTKIETQFKR